MEVSSLLARVQLMADEEVQAVRLMYDALQDVPMDYALLDCQAAFCQDKGEGEMALECAKRAVTAAPSEFTTWARLAEVYVGLEQWDLALLTLNSCPMFTYQDKDTPRMPQPSRIMLPILSESILDEIDEGQPKQGDPHDYVHPSLRKLHAAAYQGTFLKAYNLLTKIAAAIGWDQLLKVRSEVFVMEEEYRVERHHVPKPASSVATETNGDAAGDEDDAGSDSGPGPAKPSDEAATNGNGNNDNVPAQGSIERPEQTMASEVVKSGNEDVGDTQHAFTATPLLTVPEQHDPSHSAYTQFRNKRLCERWLDNLFMVLYEDLRIYTIWRTEMAQFRQQAMEYKKSATEWEILGELAERLHHFDEAIEAYQNCLATRFSPKAMRGLLKVYEKTNDTRGMLGALIRLIAWQYRWYSEVGATNPRHELYANFSPVLPGALVPGSQAHRGRGRGQGPKYRPSYEPAATGPGPHTSVLPTLRDIPQQRQ